MKEKVLSVRLSENVLQKLENDINASKISKSEYIRNLIMENAPKEDNSRQELVKRFCELYRVINEEHLETNTALMKEVTALCQILY